MKKKANPVRRAPAKRPRSTSSDVGGELRNLLLEKHAPPSVVLDAGLRVHYFHGAVREYLDFPNGPPSSEITAMVPPAAGRAIRSLVQRAAQAGEGAYEHLSWADGSEVRISCEPISSRKRSEPLFLMSFSAARPDGRAAAMEVDALKARVLELEASLRGRTAELDAVRAELRGATEDLALLMGTDAATVFLDAGLRVRRTSRGGAALLGLTDSEIGLSIADRGSRPIDAELARDAQVALSSRAPSDREIASEDGRWFIRRIVPHPTGAEEAGGIAVTFTEITGLRQSAERLRRRERQHAVIAELGRKALADTPLPELMDLMATSLTEALACDLSEILELTEGGDELVLRAGAGFGAGLAGREKVGVSIQSLAGFTLVSGGPVVVDDLLREQRFPPPDLLLDEGVVSGMAVAIGPRERPWGVVGTHSRRRQAFTEDDVNFLLAAAHLLWQAIAGERSRNTLKEREEELRKANQLKDEFLAMLGHELRNPLGAISIGTQLLIGGAEGEHRQWTEQMIARQTRHLERLVDDLLDVSRITRGIIEVRKERVTLAEMVERALDAVRDLLKHNHRELSFVLPPAPVYLLADPARMEQILGNVLSNAVKYTEEGGRIELLAERAGSEVVIRVRDDGQGIPQDALGVVFEPFVRLGQSHRQAGSGLGVGLTLVKKLTELHGGRVEVSSEGIGKGSEFVLRFPVAEGVERESAPSNPARPARTTPLRILVVDDNHDLAESLRRILEGAGHEVKLASNGWEALAVFESFAPRAALVDIGLPGMDGYELARRLRSDSNLWIGAVSGFKQKSDDLESQALFDQYFIKPLDREALFEALATLEAPNGRASDREASRRENSLPGA